LENVINIFSKVSLKKDPLDEPKTSKDLGRKGCETDLESMKESGSHQKQGDMKLLHLGKKWTICASSYDTTTRLYTETSTKKGN